MARMILLPMAGLDDMTTDGVMALAVGYAVQCGILRDTKDEDEPYALEDGWDERTVYCVGDCTTVTNFQGFLNKMRETPMRCLQAKRQCNILRKAFLRFIMQSGEWHHQYNMQDSIQNDDSCLREGSHARVWYFLIRRQNNCTRTDGSRSSCHQILHVLFQPHGVPHGQR